MNTYNPSTDTITYKDHVIENFFGSFTQQKYQVDYVKKNLMMLCIGGSHAYGLDTDSSDVDIRGIFKDSVDQILGFDKIDQLSNDTNDIVIYSFTKALDLIVNQNPNMMELLWIDDEEIIYASDEYHYLRSRRGELLSSLAMQKYSGYAISQLNRIRGHNKWLDKEQSGKFGIKPNIKDYLLFINAVNGNVIKRGSFDNKHYFMKVKDELYNVFYTNAKDCPLIEDGNNFLPVQEERINPINDMFMGTLNFNKSQFQKDLEEYNHWKKWKENRNESRHELEEKYGYDTKHACHTFRLLRMGVEILSEKRVQVKRPHREFLNDVRKGKYTYEWIMDKAKKLEETELKHAYENTKLPRSVDKKIHLQLIKIILNFK